MTDERLVFRSITVEPSFDVELRAQAQAAAVTNGQMFRRILDAGFARVRGEGAFVPTDLPKNVRLHSRSVLIADEVDCQLRAWAFETHRPKSDVLRYVLWRGLESVLRSAKSTPTRGGKSQDTCGGPTQNTANEVSGGELVVAGGRSSPVLKAPPETRAELELVLGHLKEQGVSHLEVFPFHRPGEYDYWLAFAFVAGERHTLGTSELRHLSLGEQLSQLVGQLAAFDATSNTESKRLMGSFD